MHGAAQKFIPVKMAMLIRHTSIGNGLDLHPPIDSV